MRAVQHCRVVRARSASSLMSALLVCVFCSGVCCWRWHTPGYNTRECVPAKVILESCHDYSRRVTPSGSSSSSSLCRRSRRRRWLAPYVLLASIRMRKDNTFCLVRTVVMVVAVFFSLVSNETTQTLHTGVYKRKFAHTHTHTRLTGTRAAVC